MTKPTALVVDTAIVCRRRGQSYTCIRLVVGEKNTHFIPLETMTIEKMERHAFNDAWEEFTKYEVRRAAQLYLKEQLTRTIPDDAKKALEAIVANPATEYSVNIDTSTKKEPTMAKAAAAKTPAAKTPAAKKAAPAAKTPAAKSAPAKKAAPAKQPAKAVKAVAKPGRATNDEKLKVIDPSVTRRGETAEYVTEAAKLKTFTRQQLIDKMVALGKDEKKARIKVADCVYFNIFEAA